MKKLATLAVIATLGLTACGQSPGEKISEGSGFPTCEAVEAGEAEAGDAGVCVYEDGSPGFAE
jgi:hypothetical protein